MKKKVEKKFKFKYAIELKDGDILYATRILKRKYSIVAYNPHEYVLTHMPWDYYDSTIFSLKKMSSKTTISKENILLINEGPYELEEQLSNIRK